MSNIQHWDAETIAKRYEQVKLDIINMNLKNRRFLVGLIITLMIGVAISAFYLFPKDKIEPWFFVVLFGLMLIGVIFIFLVVNTSEKCVSKLTICSIVVDDKQVFLQSISEVSCGGDAIKTFLQFCDKTTNIVKAAKGAE
ncbi:hypothetical protein [Alteromonas flava]|uniref:hypothetical protein n=1 Tax=Alteromonas flava TaxID=2048003 RepID=UPI000C292527|nr:hypothetical protein [Alteromonas flava]